MNQPEILVLRAYAGRRGVFEAVRDAGGGIVGRDPDTKTAMSEPPPELLARIDRIALYAHPTAGDARLERDLIWFRIIPGHPTVLRVTAKTAGAAPSLKIKFFVRCFLKSPLTPLKEAARFDADLTATGDASVPARLTNARWLGRDEKQEVMLTRESFAKSFRWEFTFADLALPLASFPAKVLGIEPPVPAKQDPRLFVGTWSMPGDSDPRLRLEFRLHLEKPSVASPGTYKVKLRHFAVDQFTVDKVLLRQRANDPTAEGTAAGAAHWLVEVQLPKETAKEFIDRFNEKVAGPVHGALRLVRDGQPLSLVPALKLLKGAGDAWWAVHSVVGEWETFQGNGDVPESLDTGGGAKSNDFDGGPFSVAGRAIEPHEGDAADTAAGFSVLARFPGFRTVDPDRDGAQGRALALPLLLHRSAAPFEDPVPGAAPEHRLALSEGAGTGAARQHVRLGALELAFGSPDPPKGGKVTPLPERTGLMRVVFGARESGAGQRQRPVIPRLDLALSVHALRAAGQDPLPGEEFAEEFQDVSDGAAPYERHFRREPPLVLDVTSEAAAAATPAEGRCILRAVETILTAETQTVTLRLSRPQAGTQEGVNGASTPPQQRLWIVDRDPLLFAEVRYTDLLHDLLSGTTSEIANFSTASGSVWEMGAAAGGFDLVLPPQGVGEAMEKNRGDAGAGVDVGEEALVPYRFTPPAVLRVRPSPFRQRFAEPPWNLRRLLGFPGQRAPGMPLDEARFELFYGLAGSLRRDDLQLAEIAARLGALPGRQSALPPWPASDDQRTVFRRHRARWAEWYELLLGRLAVLEPWRAGQGDEDLAITEGVHYSLRRTARLRFPVPADPEVLGRLDVPPQTYRQEQSPAEALAAPGAPLAGGIAWPFESINLYNLLWRTSESDSGELHRPYFSSLGGWGFQKAGFAQGKLRVYTDTTMGRTHSVTLEVLGRISVGWHLAKLVTVYERTVLPSRQFHESQDGLRGRPVLRKVREYVEILEPVRRFPDAGTTTADVGCLEAIEFPEGARRIPVTSRWGRDVGVPNGPPEDAEGFAVPLWVRGAQPEDVYPKPQVVAVFHPAQGEAPARCEIDEPEKLYFYVDTRRGGAADPHLWPAVQGIDFGWHPADATDPPPTPELWKGGRLFPDGGVVPIDPPVTPGLGAFTFALKPPSAPINVVATRAAQPMGVVLRNVTLMRGSAPPPDDVTGGLEVLALRDTVDAGFAAAREWIGRSSERLNGGDETAKAVLEEVKEAVGAVRGGLTSGLPSPRDLCGRLQNQLRGTFAPLSSAARVAGENFAAQATAAADAATGAESLPRARELLGRARAEYEARWEREVLGGTPLHAAAESARAALGEADAVAQEVLAWMDELVFALDALPDTASAAAAAWPEALERWRTTRDLAQRARRAGDEVVAHAMRPWVGTLTDRFRVELYEPGKAGNLLEQAIDDLAAGAMRAVELAIEQADEAGYPAAVEALRDSAAAARARLAGAWDAFRSAADGMLNKELDGLLSKVDGAVKTASDLFRKELAWIDAALAAPGAAELQATVRAGVARTEEQWDKLVRGLETSATGAVGELCDQILPTADQYKDYVNNLLDPARIQRWIGGTLAHAPALEEVRNAVEALERQVTDITRGALERLAGGAGDLARLARPAVAAGDAVLRLVRAFGDAPRVPSLDFRLPVPRTQRELAQIGYYFQEQVGNVLVPLPRVDVTPIVARANQMGKELINALEVQLPTTSLLDKLQPPSLDSFDLRKIFPSFAGLRLDDLFEHLKLPAGAGKHIRITHGADPQSLQGWVQIDVDQRFDDAVTVFTFAGMVMRIVGGRFTATSRIEGGAGRPPRQTFRGEISGNWEAAVGGFKLVTIEQTALRFDDGGRIVFDVRPDRVKLPGPMSFLADMISRFNYSGRGFTFKVTPSGVNMVLDLPLPDVQGGAFALANLRLGFLFELSVVGGFLISGGANVATRHAPFILTISAMGGAGWFDFRFRYKPQDRELVATVSIGIMAAATFAVSLGPITGGVYAYFGIVVEYAITKGAGSQLRVTLVLLFVGRVSLLGIVSAHLEIGLEAQYTSGGGLVGRGYVRVKVKVCWCFTLKLSCSVTYNFAGRGGGSRADGAPQEAVGGGAPKALAAPVPAGLFGIPAAAGEALLDPDSLLAGVPRQDALRYAKAAQAYADMFA